MQHYRGPVRSITLDVTESCPLRCDYCFTAGKTARRMSLETARQAIDWLIAQAQDRYLSVTFWGGEPLANLPLIKEVVAYAKKEGAKHGKTFSFDMTTNGVLLKEETLAYLKSENINFMVSVDGTQEAQDAHRKFVSGRGSFDIVDKNLALAVQYFPGLTIRVTLTPDQLHHLPADLLYFREKHGIWRFHWNPVFEDPGWNEETLARMEAVNWRLAEWAITELAAGRRIHLKPFVYDPRDTGRRKQHPEENYSCGAGTIYMAVTTQGSLYPCHRFHKMLGQDESKDPVALGNLHEGIIHQDWLATFHDFPLDWEARRPPECTDCIAYKLRKCNGGCMAANYDSCGSIYQLPESECRWNQNTAEISMYLYTQLRDYPIYRQLWLGEPIKNPEHGRK